MCWVHSQRGATTLSYWPMEQGVGQLCSSLKMRMSPHWLVMNLPYSLPQTTLIKEKRALFKLHAYSSYLAKADGFLPVLSRSWKIFLGHTKQQKRQKTSSEAGLVYFGLNRNIFFQHIFIRTINSAIKTFNEFVILWSGRWLSPDMRSVRYVTVIWGHKYLNAKTSSCNLYALNTRYPVIKYYY